MVAKRSWLIMILVIMIGITVITVVGPHVVRAAHSANNLSILFVLEDEFYNWDFNSETVASNNVDWPVDMVFWGNASVDKVKAMYWVPSGVAKKARVNDGQGMLWDTDSGTKSQWCPAFSTAQHMRVYAPNPPDYLYNTSWGFYVLATSHMDHNECGGTGAWSGKSEETEHELAVKAANTPSMVDSVTEDFMNFFNLDQRGQIGSHIVNNDGYATFVHMK